MVQNRMLGMQHENKMRTVNLQYDNESETSTLDRKNNRLFVIGINKFEHLKRANEKTATLCDLSVRCNGHSRTFQTHCAGQ